MFVCSRSKRTLTVNAGYIVNSPSRMMTCGKFACAIAVGNREQVVAQFIKTPFWIPLCACR